MEFPSLPRTSKGRVLAAVSAVVVLSAAVLAGRYLHRRERSAAAEFAARHPATTAEPALSRACGPGRSGPLRLDVHFPAKDGAGTTVRYSISLPDDYYSACKQYPVLYALHGKIESNVTFMRQALSLREPMAAGVLEQSIIVTPYSYSTGRWENRTTGPAEDNFIKQLIPHIEEKYRVKPGPSYRLLVGFSMGGHGAFRFGLKYPQMFAAVWSVDGAMAGSESYLPFVEGKTSRDFHIVSVGGRENGDRVERTVEALKGRGIEIPYTYQDLEHRFRDFVAEDEKAGWHAATYLQQNLGRTVK